MGRSGGKGSSPPRWRDRLDEAAVRVLVQARDEALRLSKLNVPGPRHLLVALLRGGGEPVSRLEASGVDVGGLRRAVEALAGEGRPWSAEPARVVELSGPYPLDGATEAAIEAAVATSAERGGERCSPLDLLVGVVETQQGTPLGGLLEAHGVTAEVASRLVPPELVLELDPESGTPLFGQIVGQVEERVATGSLAPGTRLPAVRRLAERLEVAPGTVARAYRELERRGVLVTEGALGTRVAEPGTGGGGGADPELVPELASRLRPVVVSAFHAGASEDELRRALAEAMAGIYDDDSDRRGRG